MKRYPLVIIGAGAAGLVIAVGAAKAGRKVLLIEKGSYGGDCTNFGCIPSKALLKTAQVANALTTAKAFGIRAELTSLNTDSALTYVRETISHFQDHEGPETLETLGIECITAKAHFVSPHEIEAGGARIFGKQIVIASGSKPYLLPIPGLSDYQTNETIFNLESVPDRLVVIGGGPIGVELAQAFCRLGASVTLIEFMPRILPREEPEVSAQMEEILQREGIDIWTSVKAEEVKGQVLHVSDGRQVPFHEILIAVGRTANVDGLALDAAGISYNSRGILVDAYGRTNQKHIWALGDVVDGPKYTHRAENQARSVLTSLLFLPSKWDKGQALPKVTYTDPECASIGLSEEEAREKYRSVAVYHTPFSEVDRAVVTGHTEGFVKIITKKWSGKILGASIVGPRAGEMLGVLSLAMRKGIPLRALRTLIFPYPSYNLALRKCADKWLTETIIPCLKSWIP